MATVSLAGILGKKRDGKKRFGCGKTREFKCGSKCDTPTYSPQGTATTAGGGARAAGGAVVVVLLAAPVVAFVEPLAFSEAVSLLLLQLLLRELSSSSGTAKPSGATTCNRDHERKNRKITGIE